MPGKGLFKRQSRKGLSPAQIFVFGFFILVILGAVVLSLPISSRTGEFTPFFESLFTAVSSTCITGLVVFDTFTHWSFFGQAVILFLIQIGGLGFMTVATLFSFALRRSIGLKERMMMAQTLNLNEMDGIVRLTKHILLGTFAFEGAAAVILAVRFIPDFGLAQGIWKGVFVSISAFCNAGFDLMGQNSPFSSLTAYADDVVVNLVICLLIVIGGLGFLVWEEIITVKKFSKMSVMARTVIVFNAALIVLGTVFIFFSELTNPETLGTLGIKGKFLSSLFQSIAPRTAGFNTLDLAALRETTQVFMIILMFIGGASGSTAGGVKINTVAVLFFAIVAVFKGEDSVNMLKRTIPISIVLRAFTIIVAAFFLIFCGSIALCAFDGVPFVSALFECTSAFCTVGLTLGITSALSAPSLIFLMILMFIGRVGLLTASVALVLNQKTSHLIQYPEYKIIIG